MYNISSELIAINDRNGRQILPCNAPLVTNCCSIGTTANCLVRAGSALLFIREGLINVIKVVNLIRSAKLADTPFGKGGLFLLK